MALLENNGVRIELENAADVDTHLRLGWTKVEGENPQPPVPKNLEELEGEALVRVAADQGVVPKNNMTDDELLELVEESVKEAN